MSFIGLFNVQQVDSPLDSSSFFTFSYLKVEKVLFLGQIFEMEILMDLHVLRSPESENLIFSKWSVCVCVCDCVCVCVSVCLWVCLLSA